MTKNHFIAIVDRLAKSVWRESRLKALAAPKSVIIKELRLQDEYRKKAIKLGCTHKILTKTVLAYVYKHARIEKTAALSGENGLCGEDCFFRAAAELKQQHDIDAIHILNHVFTKKKIFLAYSA